MWKVIFETEVGDLPMMEISAGRLTGTGKEIEAPFTAVFVNVCSNSCLGTFSKWQPNLNASAARARRNILAYRVKLFFVQSRSE